MSFDWIFGKMFSSEDQNPQPKEDTQQESKIPKKEESTEIRHPNHSRDSKSAAPAGLPTHCIKMRGHISQISKPPKDFGFIISKTQIGFDPKSVDVRPATCKLTANMPVYFDFKIDSQGKLCTEHIVVLKQELLQERSYSEGVVKFVNSSRGMIMADVTIYYKLRMIPNAKINDEVEVQAKVVAQGRLSAVSVRTPPRTKKTPGIIRRMQNGNVLIRLLKSEDDRLQSCSRDKCKYQNPANGDVVMVVHLFSQESSRIIKVQKIPTKIGRIISVGRKFGYIAVKTEARDVYFDRGCCKIPKPAEGDDVRVSFITSKGKLTAVLVRRSRSRTPSPRPNPKPKNRLETVGRIEEVQNNNVTIHLYKKDEGVSKKELAHCLKRVCKYNNPKVGDFVQVLYQKEKPDEQKGYKIEIVREILTKNGKVAEPGLIIVKGVNNLQHDVHFKSRNAEPEPAKGDTVQVSYTWNGRSFNALHVCQPKDEGEEKHPNPNPNPDPKPNVEFEDFVKIFRPHVKVQIQVENPTVSSNAVLDALINTQIEQLWKHYQAGDYGMFAKSIGPALKIKIEAENPEASSGDRDKLKINMVGKLWRLLRG
mmetsp:Transcript_2404/g.3812  ORF Transcript_2404/g.3812 Transcript_2404/m.3812 type:complete len:592 (-) Transcript_2404:196-1971(-)